MLTFIFVAIAFFFAIICPAMKSNINLKFKHEGWVNLLCLVGCFWSMVAAIICHNWF